MPGARPHYKLVAWQQAIALVKLIYEISSRFPKEEIYALTVQIRRAAVSVPSNIAEGAARSGKREFTQFLNIAKGSLSELETQLIIAVELGYLEPMHEVFTVLEKVSRLMTGLHRKIAE